MKRITEFEICVIPNSKFKQGHQKQYSYQNKSNKVLFLDVEDRFANLRY